MNYSIIKNVYLINKYENLLLFSMKGSGRKRICYHRINTVILYLDRSATDQSSNFRLKRCGFICVAGAPEWGALLAEGRCCAEIETHYYTV